MFRQALENIIERTEGSLAALIMGTDGIAVEKVLLPEGSEANLDVAAAEVTSLVRNAQRAGKDTGLGGLREMVVGFEDMTIIARLFTRDYFVVLAMRVDGNMGRGRFELRKAELSLAREFAI
ncbi:MAG TPA: roadblock/LC7 domain-containing protein [Pyrinomonadaceae bacterium]|jgi:predicted regulator of Ras-like GTPase activity (Roadblock/LC7/MglB family)